MKKLGYAQKAGLFASTFGSDEIFISRSNDSDGPEFSVSCNGSHLYDCGWFIDLVKEGDVWSHSEDFSFGSDTWRSWEKDHQKFHWSRIRVVWVIPKERTER